MYCADQGRLVPFATDRPSRTRLVVVNLARILVCAAFLLTAALNNRLPVSVVYALVGAAIAALPLHRYRYGASLVLTVVVLTAAWVRLSGLPVQQAVASAGRTVSMAAPHGLLLLAFGGWAVGLPSTFGHGPSTSAGSP